MGRKEMVSEIRVEEQDRDMVDCKHFSLMSEHDWGR